jgi:hypothetical protein
VQGDYIDFISAYCDRWCERCAFTARCSAFAVTAATAMCGDLREGLELALGVPQLAEPGSSPYEGRQFDDDVEEALAGADLDDSAEGAAARDERVSESSILRVSLAASTLSHDWLVTAQAQLLESADAVLTEALEVARFDNALIHAKLHRALTGLDAAKHGDEDDDQPAGQEDWNGSAKVALISIERSAAAWLTIAQSTDDLTPRAIAAQLRDHQGEVERAFPAAWAVVRPRVAAIGR